MRIEDFYRTTAEHIIFCEEILNNQHTCNYERCRICSFGSNNSKNTNTCVESRYQIEDGDDEILKNSAKEYLKLIKGEKKMTKSDLKDGMVVEYRNGDKRLVCNDRLNGFDSGTFIGNYDDNLISINNPKYDIVKIYKSSALSINTIFSDTLELIWPRKDKSDAEIKLEQMENQIRELEQSCKELKKELNK